MKTRNPTRPEPPRLTAAAPLELRRHGSGTHVSLARQPLLWLVQLAEDIAAAEKDRAADFLRFDSAASGEPWSAAEPQIAPLADPQQGLYLTGERHVAWFEPGSGQFVPLPGVQWHLGKALSTIEPHCSGSVDVWLVNDTLEHEAAAHEVTAHDWLGGGAAVGDAVIVIQHLQSRRWYLLAAAACGGTAGHCCQLIQVRLGTEATPTAIDSGTPVAVAFDDVATTHGEAFVLDDATGEVAVHAAGTVEIHHFDAAAVDGILSGANLTQWWVERKPPAAAEFVVIEDTVARLYHSDLDEGGATTLTRHLLAVAYGETLRVQAKRLAGSDALLPGTLAGGGPVCHLALRMLCGADMHDHSVELTSTSGTPYNPTTGSGDKMLKLVAYYRLEETGAFDPRADYSGRAFHLRVLESPGGAIDGVTGHVGTAAQIDAASEWLNRGAFGDPNPEDAFRPVSQRVSVACWLTLDSLSSVSGAAILLGLGNDNSWRLSIDASGNLTAFCGQNGGLGQPNVEATVGPLPTGKALFVVALFDGLAARAELRVRAEDSALDLTDADAVDPKPGWGAASGVWHFDIGSTSPSTHAEFRIEQLGIWNDVWLTPAQQEYLYAAGAGRRLL
jgi:hypothetical protein